MSNVSPQVVKSILNEVLLGAPHVEMVKVPSAHAPIIATWAQHHSRFTQSSSLQIHWPSKVWSPNIHVSGVLNSRDMNVWTPICIICSKRGNLKHDRVEIFCKAHHRKCPLNSILFILFSLKMFVCICLHQGSGNKTRPSALGMSDPGRTINL